MIIYGINPVLEALRAGRAVSVRAATRHGPRVSEILRLAHDRRVEVRHVDQSELDRLTRGSPHQGVIAELQPTRDLSVGELIHASPDPLIVVLDGIEDPHNVGAILRSADAAGATGVVRQSRRAAPLTGAAAKASAGALSHVRIATAVNVARAIEELKAGGVWTVGLDQQASQSWYEIDLRLPTAIVLGAEGTGLRRLVRERCDLLASIPMQGQIESLNVSVAAGIVLFEAVRQRLGSKARALRGP
ncbi:MAG: 23S rRNA (guanosine(2251)-2'-O)-methyltransferase RlmB [Acidobacteria bacterium]|nr:23S rRNA (guanosine(2251)-2'-O)-methyltransferase RlmB [Acidobacteriota bacterium]